MIEILPFALFSGAAFVVPYFLLAVFAGPEFPTIIGSLAGLGATVLAAKKKFLIPKHVWDFDHPHQAAEAKPAEELPAGRPKLTLLQAWLPYVAIAGILLLTRIPAFGLKAVLKSSVFAIDRPVRGRGRGFFHSNGCIIPGLSRLCSSRLRRRLFSD